MAIAADEAGIDPVGVEQALNDGARMIYLNRNFSNPTGKTMVKTRRRQIVDSGVRVETCLDGPSRCWS